MKPDYKHMDIERAARLRDQSRQLRRMADDLLAEAVSLEKGAYGPDALRGHQTADAAVAILRDAGQMHYTELAIQVEAATESRIAGRDRAATLLANMQRDPRFECVRPRSGVYRLRSPEKTPEGG